MPEDTLERWEVEEWRGFPSSECRAGGGRIAGIAVICGVQSRCPRLGIEGHVGTEAARGGWEGTEEMEEVGQRQGDLVLDSVPYLPPPSLSYLRRYLALVRVNYVRNNHEKLFSKLIDSGIEVQPGAEIRIVSCPCQIFPRLLILRWRRKFASPNLQLATHNHQLF